MKAVVIKILICDDSAMARKQMARSLPPQWTGHITFADNGMEGLSAIRKGLGELVFLDLNMPELDGYSVLETLRKEGIKTRVVVVSGDIQPQAYKRVMALGAAAFIKKPVDRQKITDILAQLQIETPSAPGTAAVSHPPPYAAPIQFNYHDCYQEIANVAMGQAADMLARVLNAYIQLPIPNVNMIELSELQMALATAENSTISAICQGFIGSGIAGEVLLMFNDTSFSDIAALMNYTGKIDETVELELLMDTANILVSTFLKGIAEQLNVHFSQSRPVVLGRHLPLDKLLKRDYTPWKKTLSIEINYTIKEYNVYCDLLVLFTEESINIINKKLAYLFN